MCYSVTAGDFTKCISAVSERSLNAALHESVHLLKGKNNYKQSSMLYFSFKFWTLCSVKRVRILYNFNTLVMELESTDQTKVWINMIGGRKVYL